MARMTKITKNMTFAQALEIKPEAVMVMAKYGLHCIGCHIAAYETIEQGCRVHGLDEKDMDKMLKEINETAKDSKDSGIIK